MKRSELKPGMVVENIVGKTVGTVEGKGDRLRRSHPLFVPVMVYYRDGRPRFTHWLVANVRRVGVD